MKKITQNKFLKFIVDVLGDVIVVFLLVQVIRLYIFAPFKVHGPSMCDTFNVYNGECYNGNGEYILVSKFPVISLFGWSPSKIQRGDVVVFLAPGEENEDYYIKRIIGIPGDTVKISGGFVYLDTGDGEFNKLEETYLNKDNNGRTYPYRSIEEVYTVPDGAYFALGDNRLKSSDSRRCFEQLGCNSNSSPFVDHDLLQGVVKVVIFPINHFRLVERPTYSI